MRTRPLPLIARLALAIQSQVQILRRAWLTVWLLSLPITERAETFGHINKSLTSEAWPRFTPPLTGRPVPLQIYGRSARAKHAGQQLENRKTLESATPHYWTRSKLLNGSQKRSIPYHIKAGFVLIEV